MVGPRHFLGQTHFSQESFAARIVVNDSAPGPQYPYYSDSFPSPRPTASPIVVNTGESVENV